MPTQVGYGPLWRIDGPPPSPPAYGLLQAAAAPAAGVRIVPDADERGIERWINGVEVYPYPAGLAEVFDACATGSEATAKGYGEEPVRPQFSAMTVVFAETCTSYRVWDQAEYRARALAAFAAGEGAAVEREFLSGGGLILNPHLADGSGVFPNGDAATSVMNGLALLEAEIARSGRLGLVHVAPQVAVGLSERLLVDRQSGVIRTINGTPVIAGAGYVDGATPAGHAAAAGTEEWIFATGPVDVRRSDVFITPDDVRQALDRGAGGRPNSITYRAERYYLVVWDTITQAAVLVDRCTTTC